MESATTDIENKLVMCMNGRLQAFDCPVEMPEQNEEPRTICRVAPLSRNQHGEEFDPKVISIGPLHRQKEKLHPMQQLKWKYLHDLIRRSKEENMLLKYIQKVWELEPRARKIYAGDVHDLDSSAFVEMMVIDGCFILALLIGYYYRDHNRVQLEADNWTEPLLRNDLLLLENQIPFFILQALFDLSNFSDLDLVDLDVDEDVTIPITLTKLALCYITRDKFYSLPATSDPNLTIHHLLHLFHLSFHTTPEEAESTACTCGYVMMRTIKNTKSFASGLLLVLLSLFVCQLRIKSLKCLFPIKYWKGYQQPTGEEAPTVQSQRAPRMIPNATELQESGIQFKKKKAVSLLDVVFRDGVMMIPELAIQEDTPSKFRNLIAFEQCCPSSGSHITSYATLFNNLIDTPRDVAILKECGIIESKLGQNEEVAKLFNNVCKGASLNFESHYFAELFKQVKQYCEVDLHKWRARLMHDYFSSPWATISLVAAIFLLVLTVLQTFFTIYAYYRPPNPKQS